MILYFYKQKLFSDYRSWINCLLDHIKQDKLNRRKLNLEYKLKWIPRFSHLIKNSDFAIA